MLAHSTAPRGRDFISAQFQHGHKITSVVLSVLVLWRWFWHFVAMDVSEDVRREFLREDNDYASGSDFEEEDSQVDSPRKVSTL